MDGLSLGPVYGQEIIKNIKKKRYTHASGYNLKMLKERHMIHLETRTFMALTNCTGADTHFGSYRACRPGSP